MSSNLETPCCGAPVFLRLDDMFFDGETDRCPDCGDSAMVMVADDDVEPPIVYVVMDNEPIDNWPRPYGVQGCEVRV